MKGKGQAQEDASGGRRVVCARGNSRDFGRKCFVGMDSAASPPGSIALL